MNRHAPVNFPSAHALWPDDLAPRALESEPGFPTFTYYLPSEEYRTGQSVLILPGGGYHLVSTAKEGHRPAQFLCAQGIACAVLEYRHFPLLFPVPLLDAQRALRLLRFLARANSLDADQVGVMGFSAGGHLAGLLSTQSPHPEALVGDELDAVSVQPSFCAMIYGVVTLIESCANQGSRRGLLGDNPDAEELSAFSIERALAKGAPPFFLAHGQNDTTVPVENALLLYRACMEQNVSATMHLYADFSHGVGLADNLPWTCALLEWLQTLRKRTSQLQ